MDAEADQTLDVRQMLGRLRSRAWMIVVLVLVAAVAAYGLSSRQPKLYRATAQVLIKNPNAESVFGGANVQFLGEREVATQAELIQSPEVRTTVNESLGDRAKDVDSVTVSTASGTDLIDVTVSSPVPEVARDAANLYAEVYVTQRQEQVTAELDKRAQDLRDQAASLEEELRTTREQLAAAAEADAPALQVKVNGLARQIEDFESRAAELDVEAAVRTGNVEIASSAQLPANPYAPNPRRDTAVAAGLAALLGLGLVLLLDRLDDRIGSPEQAARAADAPVLGSIPIFAPSKKRSPKHLPHGDRSLVPLTSVHAEAYRTLRTSLRFSSTGRGAQIIMVTSASSAEGKSTVTANLAVALAESGLKVVVVSADLRRPTISTMFGVDDASTGLSTTLLGDTRATDSLQVVDLPDDVRLWVMPAGPLPKNPPELLGSRAMADLLSQLQRAGVDFVLIDCPPVLPVADALAIAQNVDGVLMVTALGQTRANALSESMDALRRVGAPVLGLVINGIPLVSSRYSYFYYRNYGGETPTDQGGGKRNRSEQRSEEADPAIDHVSAS